MLTKILLLGTAFGVTLAQPSLTLAATAPDAPQSKAAQAADPKADQPLEMPKELEPVPVDASEKEIAKFTAMLENVMKSPKGLDIMQKLQLEAQYLEAKNEQEMRGLLDTNKEKLLNTKDSLVLGNPSGTVTLVLIEDPLCANCRVLQSILSKVIKQQPSLKVIVHQWAFVNPEESARVAKQLQAAYTLDPKAYGKLNEAFLALKDVPNQKTMDALIAGAKYDVKKVNELAASEDATKAIDATRTLAKELKLPGAPILMALSPEGQLMLIPPVSEQDLNKIVSDLTKAMAAAGTSSQKATAPGTKS